MLITARQLGLKVGLTPNRVATKLRKAGVKGIQKNTRSGYGFCITRDTQNYYNINEALDALNQKETK